MFNKLTLSQRVQISLILGVALFMILGSNRLNQRYYSEVNSTVNSVYKDRVVVQGYIFELNNIFHEKEVRLLDKETINGSDSARVAKILVDFGNTELTEEESRLLKDLNQQVQILYKIESSTPIPLSSLSMNEQADHYKLLNQIEQTLVGLADVQLDQSNRLNIFSQSLLDTINILSNIEIAFMILIGLIILVLIFYPFKS